MQEYKIRLPNADIFRQVQEKAFELGYKWASDFDQGNRIIRFTNVNNGNFRPCLRLESSGRMYSPPIQSFETSDISEISYQDFLRLVESTINNTTTQIMSEVTLKCIRQPQRARNITVDREYTGILIDSEDTQVDSWGEAEFFQCVNNNGLEAKYKLSLFEEPAAPVVPKITMEQLLVNLRFNGASVVLAHNGEYIEILNSALGLLTAGTVNCSCGIHSINGIDDLWDDFVDSGDDGWKDQISYICEDPDFRIIEDFVISMVIKGKIDAISTAMVMFSTTDSRTELCDLMDRICEDRNGWSTDYRLNPNSSNQIKAWLIPKL